MKEITNTVLHRKSNVGKHFALKKMTAFVIQYIKLSNKSGF